MGNKQSKSTRSNPVTLLNGDLYLGDTFKNQPHGTGTLISRYTGRYQGEFVNGQKNGQGKMYYVNGEFYNGSWQVKKDQGQKRGPRRALFQGQYKIRWTIQRRQNKRKGEDVSF